MEILEVLTQRRFSTILSISVSLILEGQSFKEQMAQEVMPLAVR